MRHAVAVGKDAIYVTANGDDTKGWVAKATVNGTNAAQDVFEIPRDVGMNTSEAGDSVSAEPLRHPEVVQDDITRVFAKSHGGKARSEPTSHETTKVTASANWAVRPADDEHMGRPTHHAWRSIHHSTHWPVADQPESERRPFRSDGRRREPAGGFRPESGERSRS